MICGHHVYNEIWTPFVGKQLTLNKKIGTLMTGMFYSGIVGRIPKELSKTFRIFMEGGRTNRM